MARDMFHQAVRHGLEKEQWVITHDPLEIRFLEQLFEIDLAAERVIGAEKAGQKIAVEIKSFLGNSAITDFHAALGQYLNYYEALLAKEPQRTLYLAVPEDAFTTFFTRPFGQFAIRRYQLKIIVYNAITEVITTWIN